MVAAHYGKGILLSIEQRLTRGVRTHARGIVLESFPEDETVRGRLDRCAGCCIWLHLTRTKATAEGIRVCVQLRIWK